MSLDDNNAPDVQPAGDESRLKFKSFMVESLNSLFGVESGFFFTFRMLLFKPWRVVHDYIHGARSRYMGPINMMLALLVYSAFFSFYFDVDRHLFEISIYTEFKTEGALTFVDKLHRLWIDIASSQQVAYLMFCPPIICGVYLAYFRHGSRRFNLTEYLVAAIYMLCTVFIYDIICMLCVCVGAPFTWVSLILIFILIVLSVVTLFKSFHVSNVYRRILLLLWCVVLTLACYAVYYVCWTYLPGAEPSLDIQME